MADGSRAHPFTTRRVIPHRDRSLLRAARRPRRCHHRPTAPLMPTAPSPTARKPCVPQSVVMVATIMVMLGLDDRQRRAPRDRHRPRRRRGHRVGRHRLPARRVRVAAGHRLARRPLRTPLGVPRLVGRVHAGVRGLRGRAVARAARGVPSPAGARARCADARRDDDGVRAVPRERHGRAGAVWGMAAMVAPAVGPTVGGWLVTSVSWHWMFLINPPIATGLSMWRSDGVSDAGGWCGSRRQFLLAVQRRPRFLICRSVCSCA